MKTEKEIKKMIEDTEKIQGAFAERYRITLDAQEADRYKMLATACFTKIKGLKWVLGEK